MIRLYKTTILLIIFRKDWSGVGVSIYTGIDDNDKWNIDICLFEASPLAEAMALSCNIVIMNSFGYDNGMVKIWYCDSHSLVLSRLTGKDVFLSVYIPLPWFNPPSLAWICHHGGRLFLLWGGRGREGGREQPSQKCFTGPTHLVITADPTDVKPHHHSVTLLQELPREF